MDSVNLRTIIEVVEKGSLTKAAESLCVSRTAVSKRLKCLEDQFGQELLDRSGTEPVLNTAGKVICAKARRILELERELEEEIKGRNWSRPLHFCCTPAFGMSHLPPIMSLFMNGRSNRQGIEIHFETPDRILSGMDCGLYDICVLDFHGGCPVGNYPCISLPGDEIVFISSSILGVHSGETPLEDLLQHNLVTRKEGCCSRRLLATNLMAANHTEADFQKVMVIDDLHLISQALRDGLGLTFLPSDLFKREISDGEFRVHRVSEFDHSRSRAILMNSDREDEPEIKSFVECIRSVVDQRNSVCKSSFHRGESQEALLL